MKKIRHSTREAKIQWLAEKNWLFQSYPTKIPNAVLLDLQRMFRDAGYYSPTTVLGDIRIENLVKEARQYRKRNEGK